MNSFRQRGNIQKFDIKSVESDINDKIRFNNVSMKYRYVQMKLSEIYPKKKKQNLFQKIRHKGPAFDSDIIHRKTVNIEELNKEKKPFSTVKSMQDIKRASENFNRYLDHLALSNKNKIKSFGYFSSSIINEEAEDNEIDDFLKGINEAFDYNQKVNPSLPSFQSQMNLLKKRNKPKLQNISKPIIQRRKYKNYSIRTNPTEKGECIFSDGETEKHTIDLNTSDTTHCKTQKNKKTLSPLNLINNSRSRNLLKDSTRPYFSVDKLQNDKHLENLNPSLKKSRAQFQQLIKLRKHNAKMLQLYRNSQDNEYTYNMQMTSAKINFLQNNIKKMLYQTALSFNEKVDHIRDKCSFTKLN